MIRLPNPFRILQEKHWQKQAEKEYQDFKDTWEFIWGIKSYDCITFGEANLHSVNDIDITYNKKEKTYSLRIEVFHDYPTGSDAERGYILDLFNELTKWMNDKKYNTQTRSSIDNIFSNGYNINTEFKSIEELYNTFKCLVKGFCTNT